MFRVLNDDESRKVTRWQAPELGDSRRTVANTQQHAQPQQPDVGADIRSLLGGADLKPGHAQRKAAPPDLQSISSTNVLAGRRNVFHSGTHSSISELSTVSAELLQASYDEGYAKGFSDGNTALHQHSVKALSLVTEALKNACMDRVDSDLEQEITALALDIASLIIRRELNIDKTLMRNIVSAGLDQLPGNGDVPVGVFLHPLDARTLKDNVPGETGLNILEDSSLDRGACRIESGSSIVNAGIDDWLASVSAQLGLTNAPSELPLEQGKSADEYNDTSA